MKKEMNDTKQQILDTALELFSHRGYSAVSIRDIGKIVGIKESTIYYYFENKQAIFQELLSILEEKIHLKSERFNEALANISDVKQEMFIAVGISSLTDFFLQNRILKFIRMLMIEQHVNKEAAKLYQHVLFDVPLAHNAAVFETLMQLGYFAEGDSDCLALEYYSPIFLIFQRYFASGDVTTENLDKATRLLTAHLKNFYNKYNLSR